MGEITPISNWARRKAAYWALLFRAVAAAFLLLYISAIATAAWIVFESSAFGGALL